METVNAIVRNTIDLKRASLIIRALSIAARNARHVRFDRCESEMVRKLPEPLPVPAQPGAIQQETSARPDAEDQGQTPDMRAWDEQFDQQCDQLKQPSVAQRKPPGRVTSAAIAQAQAVNASPQRE